MEKYDSLEIEILVFNTVDVITESPVNGEDKSADIVLPDTP